jgi:hypothetical protein
MKSSEFEYERQTIINEMNQRHSIGVENAYYIEEDGFRRMNNLCKKMIEWCHRNEN